MAEEEVGLRLSLRDRRETAAGLRDTEQGLDRVGRSAETSGRRARLASKGFAVMGKAAKVGFYGIAAGVTAVAAASVGFVKSAAEDQKSAKRLAVTLRNTTGARRRDIKSIENWISAQGKALGVTDDDLRPAIGKLAAATGDLRKAQKLTSLAMDVSAGSGKSLETVSTALAKAQGGTLTALNKLSPGLVDVKDKTVTLDQVTDKLAKRFGGQAASQANTASGKYERFKLALSETGEAIGYQLLPYANKLGNWLTDKGIPLVEKWGGRIGTDVIPAVERFVRKARPLANEVLPAVADGLGTLRDVAVKIERPLTRIFKAFNDLPDWAKSAVAIGIGGGVVAKKMGGLSLGKKVATTALGVATKAKPVPVFVTNPGGIPGTTGAPGAAGGRASKFAPLLAAAPAAGLTAAGIAAAIGGNVGINKVIDKLGIAPNRGTFFRDGLGIMGPLRALGLVGTKPTKAASPGRSSGARSSDLAGLLTSPLPAAVGNSITAQVTKPANEATVATNTLGLRLGEVSRTKVTPKIDLIGYPTAMAALASIQAYRIQDKSFTVTKTTNATLADAAVPSAPAAPRRATPRVPKSPRMSDFEMPDARGLSGAGGGETHIHLNMDGREVTTVVLDHLRDKAARS